ncbi:MAG: helix-turn-helix transcriptional regulator [Geminicoccales bacterium]
MTQSRSLFLWSLFFLQVVCTFFFASDAFLDFFGAPETPGETSDLLEAGVTLCLMLGTIFTGWELRSLMQRESKMRQQLDVASGAFADILQKEFDAWGLTEAEQSVALLGIKGYSIAEIASLRDTREGTIKAQNASVYRKAGVSGRLQLLSHFVEDLMSDSLIAPAISKPDK